MMALLISDSIKEKAKEIVVYANEHIYSEQDILDLVSGELPPPGNNELFVLNVPIGYRCVFSFETQAQGIYRHLSVSVDKPEAMPPVIAVHEIMKLFGFKGDTMSLDDFWIEETVDKILAVNLLEFVEDASF